MLRNDGDFVFTNVSSEAQINIYMSFFQSIWFDWDGDGWQDIYVINDKDETEYFITTNRTAYLQR